MSQFTLEERIAALEAEVAELKRAPMSLKFWEIPRQPPTPEEEQVMLEAEAYGRYWRVTGKEAPPDWKPGDPIPEPDWDEDAIP
jgi:hypothetical protein